MNFLIDCAMTVLLAIGVALGGLVLLVLVGVCVASLVASFFPEGDDHE